MKADFAIPQPSPTVEPFMEPRPSNQHPYSHYLAAAFAFLFDRQGSLLLLQESGDKAKYIWDLPGGTLTDQERPTDGLQREVMEETGLKINLLSPLCWLKWDRHDTGQPILVAFYVAEANDGEVSLSDEHISYRWISIEEFKKQRLELSAEWEIIDAALEHYGERRDR